MLKRANEAAFITKFEDNNEFNGAIERFLYVPEKPIQLRIKKFVLKGGDELRTTLYDFCVEHDRTDLLRQWHPTRNKPLTPETVSRGSKKKVWWVCEKNHMWQAIIYTRVEGTRCPYCAGRKPWRGENDLASQRPELAVQWHPTKNGDVTPADVVVGSHHKAWWICSKGHEWQAGVKSRTSGTGCPICANRRLLRGENDLATTHPELARQWHPTKNGTMMPSGILAGSHKKVWWRCEKGHEWRAVVAARANSEGCPVCAGKKIVPGDNDLATYFPEIAAQWHPSKNGSLAPTQVSPYSNRKVWWRCPLGHEYQAVVGSRTMSGSDCPYCTGKKVLPGFNDLATLEPQVAAQWHPALNGTLTPKMVTVGSHRKVWWQCSNGHIWKAVVYSRTGLQKCGCPVCAGKVRSSRIEQYRLAMAEHNRLLR